MDPDANLAEQRRIITEISRGSATSDEVWQLAELVEALDNWLSRGGFLPKDWER